MGIDMTGFTETQKAQLARDLDSKRVKERQGGGSRTFSYLEAWDVEDRANQIFGFDGWSCEVIDLVETWVGERSTRSGSKAAIVFRARVRVTVYAGERTIIKEDWGYGDGTGNDIGEASELAIKESVSDGEKRCFKKFGHQFGLALYDKTQEHVRAGADDEIEQQQAPSPPPPPSKLKPGPYKEQAQPEQKPEPEPAPDPTPRQTRSRNQPDPGAPKVRTFTMPRRGDTDDAAELEEIWRKASAKVKAAIQAAPNEQNARAIIAANAKFFAECKKDTGKDMVEWAIKHIEKRWPPAESTADDAPAASFDDIAPPEVHSVEAWDDWIEDVQKAIEGATDGETARGVISANQPHFATASSVVQFDVGEYLKNKLDAKFKPARRGR